MKDGNTTINLAVVGTVGMVAVVLAVGSIVLVAMGKPAPEWIGSATIAAVSGLIGYLSREPKASSHSAIQTESVDTLNVNGEAVDKSDDSNPTPDGKGSV